MNDNQNGRSLERTQDIQPLLDQNGPINTNAIVERAKQAAEVIDRLAGFALSLTESRHWVAYGEGGGVTQPFLTAPGAEMMISRLSLHVEYDTPPQVDRFEFTDGEGNNVVQLLMTTRLRVSIPGWSSIVGEGHCATQDAFLSRGGKVPVHKVDLGNVRQSAYSNALSNAVTRLLGIRRLTWDKVSEITDKRVREDNVQCADHKKGGQGGVSKPQGDRLATAAQRGAVWAAWLDGMGIKGETLKGPENAAKAADVGATFIAWVVRWAGPEKKDKNTWTEVDCKRLLDEAAQLKIDQPPEPEVPKADASAPTPVDSQDPTSPS